MEWARARRQLQYARTAQSVLHRRIGDRQRADALGHTIADFVVTNWFVVVDEFGQGCDDDYEIVERVAQRVLRNLPGVAPQ